MIPAATPRAPDMSDRPFAAPPDTVLDLPTPPSVNRVRRNHGKGTRLLDKWHQAADMRIMATGGLRKYPKIAGRFEVILVLNEDTCKLDLDNPLKAAVDYCKRLGLIVDDNKKFMRRVTLEWGEAPTGCRLILRPAA